MASKCPALSLADSYSNLWLRPAAGELCGSIWPLQDSSPNEYA